MTRTTELKRVLISVSAIVLPLILLVFGFYGSFSFTFTIPVVWQLGILGKGAGSLGLDRKRLAICLITGLLTGLILALSGGCILKIFGMTGYTMENVRELNGLLSLPGNDFSIKGEAGFRLLTSNAPVTVFASLLYCLFLVGLGEEIFWRGFIQKKMMRLVPAGLSIWITAALFGMVHIYLFLLIPPVDAAVFILLITLAGAVWGSMFEYLDNVWAPAVSHGVAAFIIWRYFVFQVV